MYAMYLFIPCNACRIFWLWESPLNFWGSVFRESERNFTIGQGPKIWGNFSKIWIKINKNVKLIEKIREKMQNFPNFLTEKYQEIYRNNSCKINKFNYFPKISSCFSADSVKNMSNWKFYPIRGSGGGAPRHSWIFVIFPKFPSCPFNFFPKLAGRTQRHKLIIHYLDDNGLRVRILPPQRQRKIKIYTKKLEYS